MIIKNNKSRIDFDRIELLDPLATGLAHEIKNPLSSLNMNIQLLKEELTDLSENKKIQKKIDIIQKESIRLEEILNDFLRFAKRKKPDLCLENVHNILDEIITFLLPEARQGSILIKKNYCKNLPAIKLDRNLIKQVLLNLIINGEQAMPDGGELSVQTSWDKENVQISLTDTGCGISDPNVNKIFDLYYSTKYKGTGLGLATVKQIVEDHGGLISVKTAEGKGSTFTLFLPVHNEIDNLGL